MNSEKPQDVYMQTTIPRPLEFKEKTKQPKMVKRKGKWVTK